MDNFKTISISDIVLILILLILSVFFHNRFSNNNGDVIHIYIDNELYAKYDLKENREVQIDGKLGKAKLIIKDGTVQLIESPCPEQICVKTGKIKNSTGQIVCAPGHFMVRFESKKHENGVDAIAQ